MELLVYYSYCAHFVYIMPLLTYIVVLLYKIALPSSTHFSKAKFTTGEIQGEISASFHSSTGGGNTGGGELMIKYLDSSNLISKYKISTKKFLSLKSSISEK